MADAVCGMAVSMTHVRDGYAHTLSQVANTPLDTQTPEWQAKLVKVQHLFDLMQQNLDRLDRFSKFVGQTSTMRLT